MAREDFTVFKEPKPQEFFTKNAPKDFQLLKHMILAFKHDMKRNPPISGHSRTFSTASSPWELSGALESCSLVQGLLENTIFPFYYSCKGSTAYQTPKDSVLILSHCENVHSYRSVLYQDPKLSTFKNLLFERLHALFTPYLASYQPWHEPPQMLVSSPPLLLTEKEQDQAQRMKVHEALKKHHQNNMIKMNKMLIQPAMATIPVLAIELEEEELQKWESCHPEEDMPEMFWALPSKVARAWAHFQKVTSYFLKQTIC